MAGGCIEYPGDPGAFEHGERRRSASRQDQRVTSAEDLLAQAEACCPAIFGRRSGPALDHVATDYARYGRAFDAFIQRGAAEQAARFIAALRDFWWARGRWAEGLAWIDRVLALPGLSPASRAMVLDHAGALAFAEGEYVSARRYFEVSLELRRTGDSKSAPALAFNHLAAAVRWSGQDAEGARALYEESLALAREAGDCLLIAAALMPLGTLALDRNAVGEARALLTDGLTLYVELQLETAFPLALEQFAAVAAVRGQAVRALQLAGAGAAWRLRLDTHPTPYAAWLDAYLSRARRILDAADAQAAWADGQAMSLKGAVAYALRDEADE